MIHVEIEDCGRVRHLWLSREKRRNAMNLAMVGEVLAAATGAASADMRVVVIRGRGGHFCSGGDVSEMGAAASVGPQAHGEITKMNRQFGHLLATMNQLPVAVIAVCEGAVMGGGVGLAAIADVTLAVTGARFRLPETSLGITPAQIMPFLVERIGLSWARRLAVTGESLSALDAARVGLAHEEVSAEALSERLEALVAGIRRSEPKALKATKALARRVAREGISAKLLDGAAEEFAALVLSEQAQQGFLARMNRVAPPWAED